ncbi:MAG: hypothetical protein R3B72_04920 [Polyangiaceae bacterium]
MAWRWMTFLSSVTLAVLVGWGCGDDFQGAGGESGGCEADASVPCNQDPWNCSAGQTCWVNMDQNGYLCLNQGMAGEGEPCQNLLGSPTCQAGLACVQLAGQTEGFCAPFCDPTDPCKACNNGRNCQRYDSMAGSIQVCGG